MVYLKIQLILKSLLLIEQRKIGTNQNIVRPPVIRPINTRDETRKFIEDDSSDDIDHPSALTFDQLTSLRSELYNINKRLNRKDNLSYHNSRQHSKYQIFESSENAGATRPSTNGFLKGELDPIDHERSKIKLKLLLQKQLKNAKGKAKIEIERRLAEIEHPALKNQESADYVAQHDYNKVFKLFYQ